MVTFGKTHLGPNTRSPMVRADSAKKTPYEKSERGCKCLTMLWDCIFEHFAIAAYWPILAYGLARQVPGAYFQKFGVPRDPQNGLAFGAFGSQNGL